MKKAKFKYHFFLNFILISILILFSSFVVRDLFSTMRYSEAFGVSIFDFCMSLAFFIIVLLKTERTGRHFKFIALFSLSLMISSPLIYFITIYLTPIQEILWALVSCLISLFLCLILDKTNVQR